MRAATWYFDFVSPFAYIGLHRLRELPADLSIEYTTAELAQAVEGVRQNQRLLAAPRLDHLIAARFRQRDDRVARDPHQDR